MATVIFGGQLGSVCPFSRLWLALSLRLPDVECVEITRDDNSLAWCFDVPSGPIERRLVWSVELHQCGEWIMVEHTVDGPVIFAQGNTADKAADNGAARLVREEQTLWKSIAARVHRSGISTTLSQAACACGVLLGC